MKSVSFQLLLRLMLSDLRLYFVSVLQNISVSISVSVNEYKTGSDYTKCMLIAVER